MSANTAPCAGMHTRATVAITSNVSQFFKASDLDVFLLRHLRWVPKLRDDGDTQAHALLVWGCQ